MRAVRKGMPLRDAQTRRYRGSCPGWNPLLCTARRSLSWQGLRCEVCWRVCPVRDKALTLVPHPRQISKHAVFVPTIDPDHCTGCGMCTKSCPTEVSAINILERKSFLGRIGEHYRLSWKTNQPHHPHIPAKDAAPQTAPVAPAGLDYLNSEEGL